MILLLACTSTPEPREDTAAALDPSLVEAPLALVERELALGVPDPDWVAEVYSGFISHADDSCPSFQEAETREGWWNDDCTTEDGYGFWGAGLFSTGIGGDENGLAHVAQYTLVRPNGEQFVGGGTINKLLGGLDFGGVFWDSADGDPVLDAGFVIDATDPSEVLAWGGFSRGPTGLDFDDLLIDGSCEVAPASGALRARDADGQWYTLVWPDCDGCGELRHQGELLGEQCLGETLVEVVSASASRL